MRVAQDFSGFNFRPLRSGRFNNKGWATFDCLEGVGVCMDVSDKVASGETRWSLAEVVFEPGTEKARKVGNSRVKSPHAAAESWEGRWE